MSISIHKERFTRIAIAVLLLSIAQWSHGGFIICYGADGHIAIEAPAAKECCKKNEPILFSDQVSHFDFNHCVDIPIGAQKYIASTSHTVPVHTYGMPLCVDSPSPCSLNWSLRVLYSRDIPPLHNPLLATLKTVVLLI